MGGITDIVTGKFLWDPIFGEDSQASKILTGEWAHEDLGLPDPVDFHGLEAKKQQEALAEFAREAENAYEGQIAETARQYEINKQNLAPFIRAGQDGMETQTGLLGLGGPQKLQQTRQAFMDSPGQQFLKNQAQQAVTRNLGSLGQNIRPTTQDELQQHATNLAQQDYSNYINRLGTVAQSGRSAAESLGNLGQQKASLTGGLAQQQGQQISGALLGQQQIAAGREQNMMNLAGQGLGAAAMFFSDVNMKENISLLSDKDLENCYNAVINMKLKSWKYLEDTGLDQEMHIGPMYQEAPEMIKNKEVNALNYHDELMMIAGAIQYIHKNGMLKNGV